MNPHDRADQAFESWLADGPTRMPEHLVDSIVTQLEQTHQRKHEWLPGREQMNRMMVAVGGVAAIALLAVAGIYFVGRGGGIGGQATPAATPTLAPTPTPPPTVAPTPTPTPTRLAGGSLLPGRYFTDIQGYRYTFAISGGGWYAYLGSPDVIIQKGNINGSDFANMWLWGPAGSDQLVWGTACNWTGTSMNPGPLVEDFATAISSLRDFQTTSPRAITLSGHSGMEVKLTVPSDANLASCSSDPGGQSEYRSWDGRYYQQPGQTDDVRVLGLGGSRALVFTTRYAGTPAATLTEQQGLFDSLDISPAPGAAPTSTP